MAVTEPRGRSPERRGAIPGRRRLLRKVWLATEFVGLFFGVVGLYTALGSPGSPIPLLLLLGLASGIYLRRQPSLGRGYFGGRAALRRQLRSILGLFAAVGVLGVAILALVAPQRLLELPLHNPGLWLLIAVFYPLVSVYPQELIFRGFLLHRYAPLLGTGRAAALASGLAFGFAHVIFGNWVAVALTLPGGVLFARRYQRAGSLLAPSVEHALYGVLIFTIGLGDFFYHGATG